jgi:hypothetical protein
MIKLKLIKIRLIILRLLPPNPLKKGGITWAVRNHCYSPFLRGWGYERRNQYFILDSYIELTLL